MGTSLQQALDRGEMLIGSWFSSPGSIAAESFGRLDFDAVVIDLQHGAVGWADLIPVLQGFELAGVPALVRTPSDSPTEIGRALDFGAAGIVVPMVSSAQQAERIVAAMRYQPHGIRSAGQSRGSYIAVDEDGRQLRRWCFPMIETVEGFENAEAILNVPGVDGLLLGPADMALAIGCLPGPGLAPEIAKIMHRLAVMCGAAGKTFIMTWISPRDLDQIVQCKPGLLIYGSEITLLQSGAQQARELVKATATGATAR